MPTNKPGGAKRKRSSMNVNDAVAEQLKLIQQRKAGAAAAVIGECRPPTVGPVKSEKQTAQKKQKKPKKKHKKKTSLSSLAAAGFRDLAMLQDEIDLVLSLEEEQAVKPALVEYKDIILGEGDQVATAGKCVTVSYKGFLSSGKCFDKSRKKPLKFVIGSDGVVEGFDDGVLGMRLGAERSITVPPDLAYGAEGVPELEIPPHAKLRFEITMLGMH